MKNTTKFYRSAKTVSRGAAIKALFERLPDADLVSFAQKAASATEAKLARVKKGDQIYVAEIRVAEDEAFGGPDETPTEEPKKEKPEPKEEGSEDAPDDDGDDDDDGEEKPEFGSEGGPDDLLGEPKAMKPEEEQVHLLRQILDALKGGAGPHGPKPPPHGMDAGPDLPDIGAPPQGEGLGGPAGPPGKAPLPPPVKPKPPGMAFSSIAAQKEFMFRRADAHEVNNTSLITEATQLAPGFRVAKIDRRSEKGAALVTMVRA